MKTALTLCLALFAASSAQAQVFRPHLHSRSGGHVHRHSPSFSLGYHAGYRPASVGFGYDRGFGSYGMYRSPSLGYFPGYDYGYYPYASYPTYGSTYYGSGYYGSGYQAGNGAANGLLLGALAGGIIGHNSGEFRHNGWRGAAWGAGLGWLLGSVVDANRRVVGYQTANGLQSMQAVQTYAPPAPQTQPMTIINNYYNTPATPMSAANGLFGR